MQTPNLSAALFRNERKETSAQPDFTGPGSVTPDALKSWYEAAVSNDAVFDERGNIKIRVAGWKKESSGGKAYISLSVSLDLPKPAPAAPAAASAPLSGEDFF
jgi:hypothetical protein